MTRPYTIFWPQEEPIPPPLIPSKFSAKHMVVNGEHLKYLRKSAGIPLRVVAEKVGVCVSLLALMEKNSRAPREKITAIYYELRRESDDQS